EPLLRQAIVSQPSYAPAYHALGLLLVRSHNLAEALKALAKAAELAPDNTHYAYVYAVALNSAGRSTDAIAELKKAHDRTPADFDILTALATIARDSGDQDGAVPFARLLVEAAPNNPAARSLLQSLSR